MNRWLILGALALVVLSSSGSVSRVNRIAQAIAFAEGFYVSGSRAERNNNPGNLTYAFGFPTSGYDGMFPIFATLEGGWAALHTQIQMMLDGTSALYSPDMTILEVARIYTTTEQEFWANNVASNLGVTISTPISAV